MNNLIFPADPELKWSNLVENQKQLLSSIPRGQRVIVRLPNTPLLAATMIAGFEQGLVIIPLDPKVTEERYKFILEHSEAAIEILENDLIYHKEREISPPHDRLLIYTSGTTGNPKAVILTEKNIRANAMAVAELHSFEQKTHATCLPMWHVNALCMSLFGSYFSKGTMILMEKYDPCAYFEACAKHDVKTASLVPALIQRLLRDKPEWPDCLEYIITAAAPLSQKVAQEFYTLYGPRLRQGYGLSEATNFSFVTPKLVNEEFKKNYIDNYPPVGLPLASTEFRINEGEVEVRGMNVMRGYWKNELATNEVLQDGWLKTGDLGFVRDGFLILTGRKKEILLRGGESIAPVEVEEEFRWSGVNGEFTIIGIDSEELGQEIGIVGPQLDVNFIESSLHKILPTKYLPVYVECAPLRTTSTGKPQRRSMAAELKKFSLPTREFEEKIDLIGACSLNDATNILQKFKKVGLWTAFERVIDSIVKARFLSQERVNNLNDLKEGVPSYIILHHIFSDASLSTFDEICKKLPIGCGFIFSEEIGGSDNKLPGLICQLQTKMGLTDLSMSNLSRADIMRKLQHAGFDHAAYMVLRHQKYDLGTVFWALKTRVVA